MRAGQLLPFSANSTAGINTYIHIYMPIEESKETLLGTSLRRSRTHSSSRISSCAHLNLRGPSPSPVQSSAGVFFFSRVVFVFLTMMFFLSTAVSPPVTHHPPLFCSHQTRGEIGRVARRGRRVWEVRGALENGGRAPEM